MTMCGSCRINARLLQASHGGQLSCLMGLLTGTIQVITDWPYGGAADDHLRHKNSLLQPECSESCRDTEIAKIGHIIWTQHPKLTPSRCTGQPN